MVLKSQKKNFLVRNVANLITPNGFFFVINVTTDGIALVYDHLYLLYQKAIGIVPLANT